MCLCYEVSIRQACEALKLHRSVYYYASRKEEQALLKQRIKDIAYSRIHYGYRRIHIFLQREGLKINHKRVYRLYMEQSLQMRTKKPKRRVQAKPREDRVIPVQKTMFGVWILFQMGCLQVKNLEFSLLWMLTPVKILLLV